MLDLRLTAQRGLLLLAVTAASAAALGAQQAAKPLPFKYAGPPTVAAITPGDLMTRLYKYADDSMMGRKVGTVYNLKATAYIESEVRRLGLQPAGDNGGYFQDLPMSEAVLDPASTLSANGRTLKVGTDFFTQRTSPQIKQFQDVPVIYGGVALDTTNLLDSATVAGKLVLLRPGKPITSQAQFDSLNRSQAYRTYARNLSFAARAVTIVGDQLPASTVKFLMAPSVSLPSGGATRPPGYPALGVTTTAAEALMGVPLDGLAKGAAGKTVSSDIRYTDAPNRQGRNVVAILPGSDPRLKGEYVAIGAHNDHVGFSQGPIGESDSLRIYNAVGRPAGAEGGRDLARNPITPEEWTKINGDIAALRKVYPPRPDSIFNGADDDGSGTVSLLEIAEAFAKGSVKPKRSILFVWHAGEEMGMWGSGYFMDNPTVPRDSIVAQLNIDMVGRGAASDVTGQGKAGGVLHGGDKYLQLVGSRRLSTELGDLVETVNTEKGYGFNFDYNIDADGHPQNIYCRSDHWSYAKWGVPVVFFTTGGHADYHQVTDEPQYIRYDSMALIDRLIFDIAVKVADLDHRVVVDHEKPNPAPARVCRQ